MDYNAFWEKVKVKGLEIGLEENYFTYFKDNDSSFCRLSNVGLKRCSYLMQTEDQVGCFIEINHTNATWNKKIYDLVLSCREELETQIGVPLEFNEAELKFGICKHPKDHELVFEVGTSSEEELAIHLLRCFYLMLEEVDHVVRNAMEEAY